ncbi:MAG TPA: SpoIIE family protein phosphatase [Bryobacteraceae bacterium]|nr:SpoIIE family protein phosphatase [Bryobacteraceae bacterium]
MVTPTSLSLIITLQDGTRRIYPLTSSRVTLGRAADNDLAYPEDSVLSRRHLLIEREEGEWYASDLGSKNGTLYNGERLTKRTRLVSGDRLNAGRVTLQYHDPSHAMEQTVMFVHDDFESTMGGHSVVTTLDRLVGSSGSSIEQALSTGMITGASRIQALMEAGRELAGHRPLAELFEVILDLAMKSVGGRRGMLATSEDGRLTVRALRGEGLRVSETVRDRVLNQRASLLVDDARADESLRASSTLAGQEVKSLIAVPLQTKDDVIGLIYIDSNDLRRTFTAEDLNMLTVMANVAAIHIEHARLIEVEQTERVLSKEIEQAAEIQRNLLPREAPKMGALDVAGVSIPCRSVGGDYFDFLRLAGNRLGVIVGDVAGKGMSAALLMSSLQARVQVLSEDTEDVAQFLTRLNRSVSSTCPENRFITFFIAVLDSVTGDFTYANAGHNPPYILRSDGSLESLTGGGPVMGVLKHMQYESFRGSLEHGDMLVLYSDGATEAVACDGEEFGESRFEEALKQAAGLSADEVLGLLQQRLEQFMGIAASHDDLTLVAVRRV